MKRQSGIWAIVLAMLAGCTQSGGTAAGDATLSIAALYSQGQCGGLDRPAVRWVARSGEWRELYARVNSQWMNPPPLPAVDFSREGVLLIAMGQRPSAGYALTLADDTATVRDSVLTVRVNWREALPGYRQAQVMTHPCLLAKLPDIGFSRIQVMDQEGRLRLEGEH